MIFCGNNILDMDRQSILDQTYKNFEQIVDSEEEVVELFENLFEEINDDLVKIKKLIEEKNKINKKWHSIKSKFRSISQNEHLENKSINDLNDIEKLQLLSFNFENKDNCEIEDYEKFINYYKHFYLKMKPNNEYELKNL